MKLSVVIPVMNEEDNIIPLHNSIHKALDGKIDYEVIYVDDGSTDTTVTKIKSILEPHVKLIEFARNFGQTNAMVAGIDEAQGELIATLDGDLQNDPEDILPMIDKLNEGYDVVAGVRANRQDGAFLRKFPSKIANAIIRKTTGVYIKDYGCTLKVFKKEIAKNLGLYGELHRFIPVLAHLRGAKMTQIDVRHHARIHGDSKYGMGRTLKVISDLMLLLFLQKYGQKPIHFFGTFGFVLLFFGLLVDGYMFLLKLFGEDIGTRPLLTLGVLLTIGGIQLITTGFLAEIMMRTYYESQNKTTYIIRKIWDGQNS